MKNHISENDERVFKEALIEQEINGELYTQAANSPDMKLLHLGFFRVIQSFTDAVPKNEAELIHAVRVAFKNYPRNKINHTWLTFQCCFNQIIKNQGGNKYKIDHILKERLEHIGQLPDVMEVVVEAQQLFNTSEISNEDTEDTEIG